MGTDISPEQINVVRAYLVGADDFPQQFQRLHRKGDLDGYCALLGAAFLELVGRKFPDRWQPSDLIRYVAHTRSRYGFGIDELDPGAAERVLLAALGQPSAAVDMDDVDKARAQYVLLQVLCRQVETEGVDNLLERARARAERTPDRHQYFAVVDETYGRESPFCLLRRMLFPGGGHGEDEAMSPAMDWKFSTLLLSHERGDTQFDFIEIDEVEAKRIEERFLAERQARQG